MRRSTAVKLALVAACLVALTFAARSLPVDRWIAAITESIRSLGAWGPAAFGLLYVVATVLLFPGALLTLAAGGLFGVVTGFAIVSAASTLSAALAFLIGRFALRGRVRAWIAESPRLAAVDAAVGREGWKIVALMRLSPAVPFSVFNYVCGVTSVPFRQFVPTSWLAMIPGTLLYVYLGSIGADAVSDRTATRGTWALRIAGLVATAAATWVVTRVATRALRDSKRL